MKNIEKEILQAYVETIKSIGGRGPKNIFVKIWDQRVEIHFVLVKSPLEVFILNHFKESEAYLENMYLQMHHCISERVVGLISERTGIDMICKDFLIDVRGDKFCLILEMTLGNR